MLRSSSRNPSGRRNFLAACVSVFSAAVLYTSFDPVPAGEDLVDFVAPQPVVIPMQIDVPLPPEAALLDSAEVAVTDAQENQAEPAAPAQQAARGSVFSDMETIKFCVLMLQDGARYMENMSDYTAQFHKEERISGDLKKPQSMAIKVQHAPHFAVYMKWLNGERGRQVLYSQEYDDQCMTVKFGGLKRILPAVKVDPNCSIAKSESRYPITQAGVLGMIKQILAHREEDLKRGHGVTCTRLPNQEFDNHDCFCFLVNYEDQKYSEVYRKSLLLIDTRRHIPLMVRNFTWGTDCEGLSPEELDAATLVENYSFTNIDTSSKLAAKDFSRENPSYRM